MSHFLEQLFQMLPGDPDVMRGKRDRQQMALVVKVEDLRQGERPALASLQLGFAAPLLLRLMRRHLPSLLAARRASSGVMGTGLFG